MTSRWPYWCPETIKRRPCWCPKPILRELNSFLMQTLSFVPINLHRCWPREWNTLLLFCRSRCRRRRRCLSSLSLKRLCHGCLLHFVTIVTRIRLIKACIPLGRISDRTPETAKTERGYFLIYIVYLLSSVFRVFLFSVSNWLLFCFYCCLPFNFSIFGLYGTPPHDSPSGLKSYPDEMWMMWYNWLGFNLRKKEWSERAIREPAS